MSLGNDRRRIEAARSARSCGLGLVRRRLFRRNLFARNKINLFKDGALLPARPLQDAPAVFNHVWMSAQIASCLRWLEAPFRYISSDQIIYSPGFPGPRRVFPRPADGGHKFQPGHFRRKPLHFFAVPEFPRAAPTLY